MGLIALRLQACGLGLEVVGCDGLGILGIDYIGVGLGEDLTAAG